MEATISANSTEILTTVLSNTNNNYNNLIQAFGIFIGLATVLFTINFIIKEYLIWKKIDKKLNIKVTNAIKDLDKKLDQKAEKIEKDISKNISNETKILECNIHRSFAYASLKTKDYQSAVGQMFSMLEVAIEINSLSNIQTSVSTIYSILINEEFTKDFSEDDFDLDKNMKIAELIPHHMSFEKRRIIQSLNKMGKKFSSKK